jgi:hypothetical protein
MKFRVIKDFEVILIRRHPYDPYASASFQKLTRMCRKCHPGLTQFGSHRDINSESALWYRYPPLDDI